MGQRTAGDVLISTLTLKRMDGMTDGVMRHGVSRRDFLRGAAALGVAHSVSGTAQKAARSLGRSKVLAYVGSYTGAVGGGSNGEGIYLFEMDKSSGWLTHRKLVATTPNASWIAIHPSKKYLYAVNEVSDYQGNSGSVSAFAIDESSGDLTALNVVSSEGAGPCYLSIDISGKHAFVANYGGGTTAVLPILDGGKIGAATDIRRDSEHLGAAQASNPPVGSYAVSGHDAPHAHDCTRSAGQVCFGNGPGAGPDLHL
jgi:6-phosphogluconolactonase